jgi:hypothetical protein
MQKKLRTLLQMSYDWAKGADEFRSVEEIHRLSGTISVKVRVTLCDINILGHISPKRIDVFMIC